MSAVNMVSNVSYQDFIKKLQLEFESSNPEDWLQSVRRMAYERFQKLGFPNRKMETWRYTNFEKILKSPFLPSAKAVTEVPDPDFLNVYNLASDEVNRLSFVNGNFMNGFSSRRSLPKGVIISDLATALEKEPKKIRPYLAYENQTETNPFAAINTFSFSHGLFLYVPKFQKVDLPIHLLFGGVGEARWPMVFYPRILIVLEEDTNLNLIMDHVSLDKDPYFMNSVIEVHLGKGSQLHWSLLQRQSAKASQFMAIRCYQQANSRFESRSFMHGSDVTHNEMEVTFEGENASCDIQGLSLLSGKSEISQSILVNHKASHCQSRQVFKNILADKTQAEFNSIAFVHKGTQGSDSGQLNRNLLLSDFARAYSRPQLKIDSDDVKATHGSATGQLDEKELFYLRSRGLDLAVARFVLTLGFAEEILETIQPDAMRWQLELLVRKEIEAMFDPGRESVV